MLELGDRNKTAAEATSAAGIITVSSPAGSTSVVTLVGSAGTITKTLINDGTALPVVLTAADLTALGEGAVAVTTVTTDTAGNITTSANTADGDFTLDTIAPAVAAAGLTASTPSDTGILGDGITSNPGPSISGSGNPGDTITLFAADGTTLLGTARVDAAGTWSITLTGNYLIEGLNTFSVRATDLAGNTGAARSIALTLDRSLPTVIVMDNLVRGELFEGNTLTPTEILPRANTGLHVQQTVNSTLLMASNNPGMRIGEVDIATATELMGAMGNDLFVVMDSVLSESTNLTDMRKHTGKGLEIKQSQALFVTQAVHQLALTNDHLTLVQYVVRTSQLESAARAAMVQVASNSALVGTSTLFDPFALGFPRQADPAAIATSALPISRILIASSSGTSDARWVAFEAPPSVDADHIVVLPEIEKSPLITRRAASAFSSQIKHSAVEFKPRRV